MVRAKGKANASTNGSVSKKKDAAEFSILVTDDNIDMTDDVEETKDVSEAGESVETTVQIITTEQRITTVLSDKDDFAEEENDEAEAGIQSGEQSIEEDEDNQTNAVIGEEGEEENDEAEVGSQSDEQSIDEDEDEDEDNQTNAVIGEEDEQYGSENDQEDAIGNSEDNDQENAMEQEDSREHAEEKHVGGSASIDKDNHEDTVEENEDEKDTEENNKGKGEDSREHAKEKRVGGSACIDKDNREDAVKENEDENNTKENNEGKGEGSSKQTTNKLKKRNRRKRKVASGGNAKQDSGNLAPKFENEQGFKKRAVNGKAEKITVRVASKDDEQSSKKGASGDKSKDRLEKVDVGGKDRPGPSSKKKSSKKADSMGMIFMCNSETKKECYRYKVLGMSANKKEMVEKIHKGMRLFLYDVDLKLMYGIYRAAGNGGYNIEPKAFRSQFPSQVRFSVLNDCLPIAEETFKKVIKKNYFSRSKFDCQLSSEQVKDLCKLFTSGSKGPRSKDERHRLDSRITSKKGRSKRQGPDGKRRSERGEERGYREQDRVYGAHGHLLERGLYTSPLVALAPLQHVPPPAIVQPYAYSRALETDAYRRDRVVQHNDSYRQVQLVDPRDIYRQDVVLGNPDVYRRHVLVERPEYQPLNLERRPRDDVVISDPYASYRHSYQEQTSPRTRPEYNPSPRTRPEYNPSPRTRPEYNPSAGLRSEYRLGEYSSSRSMLPEYSSEGNLTRSTHPDYDPPASLRPEYRLTGSSTDYSSTRIVHPEYRAPAGSLSEYYSRRYRY